MNNKVYQQFFSLLRAGLWNIRAENKLFSDSTDWNAILSLAYKQTVTGVVYDGIIRLPTDRQPGPATMRKLYSVVVRIEQSHELINQRLAEVISALQAARVHPVLLKGQGVALNYPNPVRRQCGDIDLYIGEKKFAKARAAVQQLHPEGETETWRHYHFNLQGVTIELHRLAEELRHPLYNARFQHWTKFHLLRNKQQSVCIGHTQVALPPVNFNALYLFNHAYYHLIRENGVGLRQLCDWTAYLHAHYGQIDRQRLRKDLKSFGLLRAWKVFGHFAVDRLGLPPKEFPLYTRRYEKIAKRILLNMILPYGNFGGYDTNRSQCPEGYLKGKWYHFKLNLKRTRQLFPLAPAHMSIRFIKYLFLGTIQLLPGTLKANR